jgi:hypothetical protein
MEPELTSSSSRTTSVTGARSCQVAAAESDATHESNGSPTTNRRTGALPYCSARKMHRMGRRKSQFFSPWSRRRDATEKNARRPIDRVGPLGGAHRQHKEAPHSLLKLRAQMSGTGSIETRTFERKRIERL